MANIFKNFDDENMKNITKSEQFKKVANDKNVKDLINNEQFKKVANDKNVKDLMNNDQFIQFKEKYKNKSDDEILNDAKDYGNKLKEQYGEKEYNKKIEELKKFEMFLNPEQRSKMKKFLENLK